MGGRALFSLSLELWQCGLMHARIFHHVVGAANCREAITIAPAQAALFQQATQALFRL
jgi:hypothetical protein